MSAHFNFLKTLQASAVLLESERGRQMSYLRLLKLLYLAERALLATTAIPLTGDNPVAMKKGPVLSQAYATIKGETSRSGEWETFIHREGRHVELIKDPGRGKLSKREIRKLQELSEQFRFVDDWSLVEETHKLPEWKKAFKGDDTITPFSWEQVLEEAGRADLIPLAKKRAADRQVLNEVFGTR